MRTVVAFGREEDCRAVASLMEKNGVPVRCRCRTGLEVIRAVGKLGGGVVVCGSKLPDMTADELCSELEGRALFLVLAKPAQLALCEREELFRLALPVRGRELAGSLAILLQLDRRRGEAPAPPRRPIGSPPPKRNRSCS